MLIAAFFYYEHEKRLYTDLTKSNMQNITSDISSKIILSHMTGSRFERIGLLDNDDYKLSFYNEKKEKIGGNLDKEFNAKGLIGSRLTNTNLLNKNDYKISSYNKKIDKVYGNTETKPSFTKLIVKKDNHLVLIDNSVLGHLGIYYIVIEEHTLFNQLNELKFNILVFFLLIYLIIALIGIYLAKLFLRPIKEERIKLNNFIKDTTHELNTPITALLMSTESENLSKKQVQRVKLSAQKISEVYKDLTYLFLENHTLNKETIPISINEIIDEQLIYFEPLLLKKKINITKDINSFDYIINKNDFVRLFNNIISNSIKYNDINGNISILLTNNGELKISDNGIGIEKTKIDNVCNRYYRATNEQGGFGIGLNIVRNICKRYDIKIAIDSVFHKGTTFTFSFK